MYLNVYPSFFILFVLACLLHFSFIFYRLYLTFYSNYISLFLALLSQLQNIKKATVNVAFLIALIDMIAMTWIAITAFLLALFYLLAIDNV